MKKVFQLIFMLVCWIVGGILLYETIVSLINSDPWGLGFMFFTLPLGVMCFLFLSLAILLMKEFVKAKKK